MKISDVIVVVAMSLFLSSENVGIIGAISFLVGLSIILTKINGEKKNNEIS